MRLALRKPSYHVKPSPIISRAISVTTAPPERSPTYLHHLTTSPRANWQHLLASATFLNFGPHVVHRTQVGQWSTCAVVNHVSFLNPLLPVTAGASPLLIVDLLAIFGVIYLTGSLATSDILGDWISSGLSRFGDATISESLRLSRLGDATISESLRLPCPSDNPSRSGNSGGHCKLCEFFCGWEY
ncbi:hypothetical protein BJ508DRAFT_113482 [Ascobolus immersus RN42]|uniref:Uncharacterized protein n=1 Tax=Ascobolus immersus RN42 TaxID=1160509 RepID=A0A3N4IAV6_ASCIM|nr:hypothetical protein BJ508DRAFT_113482 [Ascobolus immersus RN42]